MISTVALVVSKGLNWETPGDMILWRAMMMIMMLSSLLPVILGAVLVSAAAADERVDRLPEEHKTWLEQEVTYELKVAAGHEVSRFRFGARFPRLGASGVPTTSDRIRRMAQPTSQGPHHLPGHSGSATSARNLIDREERLVLLELTPRG